MFEDEIVIQIQSKEIKKTLCEKLKELKIIDNKFTGKIVIDLNQGGIGKIHRGRDF